MEKERDNFFILLGLPFDPPEKDEAKISAAISDKQQQWSKDQSHPAKKIKAAQCLGWLGDIQNVMLGRPELRQAEAEAAKAIRLSKQEEVDNALQVHADTESELSESALKSLLSRYRKYGYDEEFIKMRFRQLAKNNGETGPDVNDVISKEQAKNIRMNLEQLGNPDGTLYTFLNRPSSASCELLLETAKEKEKKLLSKGKITGTDTAEKALCGLCGVIFKNNDSKRKYDNYCALTKYHDLNILTDELAQTNGRKIEPKGKGALIDNFLKAHNDVRYSEVSLYIDNYCAFMGYTLQENKIICGTCGAENPAGAATCSQCGRQLIITCPACGAKNDNAAKSCVKCGFDLSRMEEARQLIQKAKDAVREKKYSEASDLIGKAKLDWPNHPDIVSVEKSIQDFRDRYDETLKGIQDDIAGKRYYTARTKIQKAKSEGFTVDSSVSSQVERAISTSEARVSEIRQMEKEDAFLAIQDLAQNISDSKELQILAGSYPPEAVTNAQAVRHGQNIVVSWEPSASKGKVEYILVRKENAYANSPEDGKVVYEGTECSYTDTHPEQAVIYYYIVLAKRLNVLSTVTRIKQPQVVVEPVTGLKALGGDRMISLSWNRNDSFAEVQIGLCQKDSQPVSEQEYRDAHSNRRDGATLSGLENGMRYWLRVVAWYTIGGSAYPADAVIIQAMPQKPAKPLENFHVSCSGGKFHAVWKQSDWDVILYCSGQKPNYSVGAVYDAQDLADEYEKIDLAFLSLTEADFAVDFTGECYIIPGVISANNVILSRAVPVSNVPPVSAVSFDLNSSRTELCINFNWPDDIDRTVFVYRTDQYPDGPEDPLASRINCTRKRYNSNDGILLAHPEEGILYGAIYACFDSGDHQVYSEGVRIQIDNEPKLDVLYGFAYRKKRSKNIITVTVKSKGTFVFPPFVIVGKFKALPLNRSDGDVLCSVTEPSEINGSKEFQLEVSGLREGYKLKMFFIDDESYKKYTIQNEGKSAF